MPGGTETQISLCSDWIKDSCAVSVCSTYTDCSTCSSSPSCGWCDGAAESKCLPGDAFAPSVDNAECRGWFFHYCVTVVKSNVADFKPNFLSDISVLNCNSRCVRNKLRHNVATVMWSEAWCQRYRQACSDFYDCFNESTSCGKNSKLEACRTFSADKCRDGIVPIGPTKSITNDLEGGKFSSIPACANVALLSLICLDTGIETPNDKKDSTVQVDLREHIWLATFEYQRAEYWEDYGCYCGSILNNIYQSVGNEKITPVDETDECCSENERCYARVAKQLSGCNCQNETIDVVGPRTTDWIAQKGFCKKVGKPDTANDCRENCCDCNFKTAECLRDKMEHKKNDELWKHWRVPESSQCSKRCGNNPSCPCEPGRVYIN